MRSAARHFICRYSLLTLAASAGSACADDGNATETGDTQTQGTDTTSTSGTTTSGPTTSGATTTSGADETGTDTTGGSTDTGSTTGDTEGTSGTDTDTDTDTDTEDTEGSGLALPFFEDFDVDAGLWTFVDEVGADNSAPSNWFYDNGNLAQTTNIHGLADPDQPGSLAHYGDPEWTDVVATVNFTTNDNDGLGVIVRYQDEDNYVRFHIDRQRQYARLVIRHEGTSELVEEVIDVEDIYMVLVNHTIALQVVDQTYTAWVDDSQILEYTDTEERLATGEVALFVWGQQGTLFHSIGVEAP
jgi:hypothetical protein